MNRRLRILSLAFISLIVNSCITSEKSIQYEDLKDRIIVEKGADFVLEFDKGISFNHPTFVIWTEDMEGNFLKTIFITRSYASGIFGYQLVGDTVWLPQQGPSYQPAALPYWTYKKGFIVGNNIIPTPEHPYADAYTGATPKGSFRFETLKPHNNFRLLVEINQAWDWNSYWTNNRYPESDAYKHSAQPSLIYAVTINSSDSIYYLNPIGHGNPKGEDGKLYTDLGTITTAKQIFSSIKAIIKSN